MGKARVGEVLQGQIGVKEYLDRHVKGLKRAEMGLNEKKWVKQKGR